MGIYARLLAPTKLFFAADLRRSRGNFPANYFHSNLEVNFKSLKKKKKRNFQEKIHKSFLSILSYLYPLNDVQGRMSVVVFDHFTWSVHACYPESTRLRPLDN